MKKTIRLTESDLHRIVKESVNRILKEDVIGTIGKKISSYDTNHWYFDDDNESMVDLSRQGEDDFDEEYPYEHTNQTLNSDTVAFLHRIEKSVKQKFGGLCDITYGMDRDDKFMERGSRQWNETEYFDKVHFYWQYHPSVEWGEASGSDVFQFVLKMIRAREDNNATKCNNFGLTISNVKTTRHNCELDFSLIPRIDDLGRNNKINVGNKHGNARGTGYRYGEKEYDGSPIRQITKKL